MRYFLYTLLLICCVNCSAATNDSAETETFKKLLLPLKDSFSPAFLSSCKFNGDQIVLLVIDVNKALMVSMKERQVNLLAEITFSAAVPEPLIETNGGFERAKKAKVMFEKLIKQEFSLVKKVDYSMVLDISHNKNCK